jgi:hypothetical protein
MMLGMYLLAAAPTRDLAGHGDEGSDSISFLTTPPMEWR